MKAKFLYKGKALTFRFELPFKGTIVLEAGKEVEIETSIRDAEIIESMKSIKDLEITVEDYGSLVWVGNNANKSANIELLEQDESKLWDGEKPGTIARCIDTGRILTLGKFKSWHDM